MSPDKSPRITRRRQVILEELKKVTSHPTAGDIFQMVRKRLPGISLATIYRNLEILSESGMIQQVIGGGGQRRYDGIAESHPHIRCTACGRVDDMDHEFEPQVTHPSSSGGYSITGYNLEFLGICPECMAREAIS